MGVKIKYLLVFLLMVGFGDTQDDGGAEAVQSETASEDVQPTDVICQMCRCVEGVVECSGRGVQAPFLVADWAGLKTFKPTKVDLSNNPMGSLTQIPELPIQNLTLYNCEIESIAHSAFRNLVDLVTLDLSSNRIATAALSRRVFEGPMVPGAGPRPFTNMRTLNLAYNDVHSLPQDIFMAMTDLTSLDLSGNPLAYIDQVTMAAITELTKLKELKLSSCELESLPEGLLRRQRRLESLDLSDNRFTTVPSVLSEAVNLVFLNFNKNPVESISEKTAISNLTKLQELHLCRISKLKSIAAGALGGLESLVHLEICYNPRLTTLEPGFLMWTDDHDVEKYPLLQKLYLNGNNITQINSHYLDRWDQLIEVDFTSNPYDCDCGAQWMVDVLIPLISTTATNDTISNMYCKKPQELRGMSFASLKSSGKTLTCPESEEMTFLPSGDMAIALGITIGIFTTFPIVLIIILLWRRGYFAKCRRKVIKEEGDGDDEDDAF